MLTTSVAVVRKMLDAVAGSAPSFRSVRGISDPGDPADDAGDRHGEKNAQSELKPRRVLLHRGGDPHSGAGRDPDERPVQEAEQRFLGDQPLLLAGSKLAEREPSQGDRERLTPGVAGLPREDGQEDGEDHDAVDRPLEDSDDRRRQKGGQEVQLEPGMPELQAAGPRREEPLLLVDADHRPGLGADLDRLLLEHRLSADLADERPVGEADGIHGKVPVEHEPHRVAQLEIGGQEEHVSEHHVRKLRRAVGKEQVAHRHDPDQVPLGVHDEPVGHEGVLDELANRLDRLPHRDVGRKDCGRGLHHAADRCRPPRRRSGPTPSPPPGRRRRAACAAVFHGSRRRACAPSGVDARRTASVVASSFEARISAPSRAPRDAISRVSD